jgi:hypothetical protein
MRLIIRMSGTALIGTALILGTVGAVDGPARNTPTSVQLASYSSSLPDDLGDDVTDGAKCAYKVVGAKVAQRAGKSIWGKVKQRKLPSLGDIRDAAAGAAVTELASSNPYVAGGLIFGCTMLSSQPAE